MFGMDTIAKQALSSPDGQKMLMEFLSSPEGMKTIREFAGTPQGKQLIGTAISSLTKGLGLPDDQAAQVSSIIGKFV